MGDQVQPKARGRQAGKQTDCGLIRLRLTFVFKSCDFGHCLLILPPTIYETLKWLTPLPILVYNHSVGDSVALDTVSDLHPLFPVPCCDTICHHDTICHSREWEIV